MKRLDDSNGVPLGWSKDASYPATGHVRLDDRQFVVMVTDGILETEDSSGVRFGDAGLLAAVEASAQHPADAICESILDSARNHRTGTSANDDQAVIVLRRNDNDHG